MRLISRKAAILLVSGFFVAALGVLLGWRADSSHSIVRSIEDRVAAFSGGIACDDLTLVCVRIEPVAALAV